MNQCFLKKMIEIINAITGIGIIILNLIPFITKQSKYLFLTILTSFLILFLLVHG